MELDVLDGLAEIPYPLDEAGLKKVVGEWPVSVEYTKLVEHLSKELQHLCKLDEHVNALQSSDDNRSFLLELSSFLKELGCPYKKLTEGSVDDRLKTAEDRYTLLDFLITEVLAARMLSVKKPKENNLELMLDESETASAMRKMLMALSFPKPPSNITAAMLFSKVLAKTKELSQKLVSEPLFSGFLSPKQWATLASLHEELHSEYKIRRQLLLKRLDVTIQSFQWSERMKGRENEIAQSYLEKRRGMSDEPAVKLSDVIGARAHLAILEKTSNANVRKNTKSSLNKVIIGRVPDRGGRPQDQQPPPPEMPSWAPRASQPQGGGGFGGGGGGGGGFGGRGGGGGFERRGGGSRVQGGWSGGGDGRSGGYQGNRDGHQGGGYQGNRDNHQGGGYQGNRDGHQGGGYRGNRDGHQGGGRGGYQGGRDGGERGGRGRGRDRDRY